MGIYNINATILIIEDDPLFAERLRSDLKKNGYIVAGIARSLESAVQLMSRNDVDLAIIDIWLEGSQNGIDIAKALLKLKNISIIYVTGLSREEQLERSKETFPFSFMVKPVNIQELLVQIDLAINKNNENAGKLILNADYFFVFSEKGYIRIKFSEILYIYADRIYSKVFLTKEEHERLFPKRSYGFIHISANLGRIMRQLPADFFQLSRSVVINLTFLDKVESEFLVVADQRIEVPDGIKNNLLSRLNVIRSK